MKPKDEPNKEVLDKLPEWWREIRKSVKGDEKNEEPKNNGAGNDCAVKR